MLLISNILHHPDETGITRPFPTLDLILTFGLSHPSHSPGSILGRLREEIKNTWAVRALHFNLKFGCGKGLARGSDAML